MMQLQKRFWLIALVFCFAINACATSSSLDIPTEDEKVPEVGTSSGNPSLPKTTITMKSFGPETNSGPAFLVGNSSHPYCSPFIGNEQWGHETQLCHVRPQKYQMGILAIDLIECTKDGAVSTCQGADTISKRVRIYSGSQVNQLIDNAGVSFDGTLTEPAEDLQVGGIQVVVAHIMQYFPEETGNKVEAAKLHPSVQGMHSLLCTTPENEVTDEVMQERCLNVQAQRGDILIDQNHDGTSGFFFVGDVGLDINYEIPLRPKRYEDIVGHNGFMDGNINSTTIEPTPEFTDGSFYDIPGYYAPVLSLKTVVNHKADTGLNYLVAFKLDETIGFLDGFGSMHRQKKPVCVAAIADSGCPHGDDDPKSVGIYDPRADGVYQIRTPQVEITTY